MTDYRERNHSSEEKSSVHRAFRRVFQKKTSNVPFVTSNSSLVVNEGLSSQFSLSDPTKSSAKVTINENTLKANVSENSTKKSIPVGLSKKTLVSVLNLKSNILSTSSTSSTSLSSNSPRTNLSLDSNTIKNDGNHNTLLQELSPVLPLSPRKASIQNLSPTKDESHPLTDMKTNDSSKDCLEKGYATMSVDDEISTILLQQEECPSHLFTGFSLLDQQLSSGMDSISTLSSSASMQTESSSSLSSSLSSSSITKSCTLCETVSSSYSCHTRVNFHVDESIPLVDESDEDTTSSRSSHHDNFRKSSSSDLASSYGSLLELNSNHNKNIDYYIAVTGLFLGDSSVGKSTILRHFIEGCYIPDLPLTRGVDFRMKVVDGIDPLPYQRYQSCIISPTYSPSPYPSTSNIKYKCRFWDTAGSIEFHNLTHVYYKDANVIGLVYDVHNRETFDNLDYWVDAISKYGNQTCRLVLIANKIDQERQVSRENGMSYAKEIHAKYFECSAISTEDIQNLFQILLFEAVYVLHGIS